MIDWQQIDTVLLDMDGTLLDLHFDNYFWLVYLPRHYATLHQLEAADCQQQLSQRFARERGTLNWYCLDYWSEQLQLDIPALKREIQHLITVRPYVEEFLRQLQSQHRQVFLVTNAHHDSLRIKLENTDLEQFFDQIIISHDFQLPKEDPLFWQELNNSHPFDPAKTLLIDDTISVLAAAQQYGIRHLLTLLQPDSKAEKREQGEFPGILHFDEIMPPGPC